MTAGFNLDFVDAGPLTTRLANGGPNAYYHSDHLTSSVAQTRTAGTVSWHKHFTPFGERLIGEKNGNVQGYTNHVRDAATGLNYMQARYYDPIIGRFLQTDPIGYEDQMNLYAYCGNDPIICTDPTGEFGLIGAGIGALIGGGVEAAKQFAKDGKITDPGKIAKEAVVGGALGFVGGAGATFIKAGVKGAITVGKTTIPIAGTAARTAIAVDGAILNTTAVLGANGREAKANPDVDLGSEVATEAALKTGGDIVGAATGVPGVGGFLVGVKDVAETLLNADRGAEPSTPEIEDEIKK